MSLNAVRERLGGREFVSANEAGTITGLGCERICRAIHAGKLAASNTSQGKERPRFRIALADLEAYMQSLLVKPPKPKAKRAARQQRPGGYVEYV